MSKHSALLRLSVQVAKKAMREGKSPRETVEIMREMYTNQQLIDAGEVTGAQESDDEVEQAAANANAAGCSEAG